MRCGELVINGECCSDMALSSRALQESPRERMAPLRVLKDESHTLLIHEIYHSIQGEGTRAGRPCTFIRLTGCHLRCSYCDSEPSFHDGRQMTIDAVTTAITQWPTKLIQITGGEPLLQKAVYPLMRSLSDLGYEIILETSGALSVEHVDPRVICILDIKTPSSGEAERFVEKNLTKIRPCDELKFVISNRADYAFAVDILERSLWQRPSDKRPVVLFSPEADSLSATDLAEWILEDQIDVRLQIQMHKVLWGNRSGV